IRRRVLVLCIILLCTTLFAYQLRYLKIYTSFDDLLPQNHPYVKLHNKFRKIFGGANQVTMMIEVKEGDIFNVKTLEKIKYLDEQLPGIPAADPYKVFSLASRNLKEIVRTSGTMRIRPVMFPDIPRTNEELEDLRWRIYGNDMVFGSFVSYDTKKTLLLADFFDEEIDYSVVFERLSQLRKDVEDDNTILSIAGTPMHLGYVWYYSRGVVMVLGACLLVILLVLYIYFRSIQGVVVPFASGLVSGIWGLGIMSLFGYNLDPLILVLPFLLALMTVRHAMQKLVRYTEEYMIVGNGKIASRNVIKHMFAAGITGIITDSFGIALIAIAAIPILQKTAVVCALWALPTLIVALIFTPILLSFMPVSSKLKLQFKIQGDQVEQPGPLDRLLAGVAHWITRRGKWYVVTGSVILIIFGWMGAERITIGSLLPGSSILWPHQRFNQDALRIAKSMPLLNPLYIIVEGTKNEALRDIEVIRAVYKFNRFLSKEVPGVIFARSIMDMLPSNNTAGGEGDPRWKFLVDDKVELENTLTRIMFRGGPGTWDKYVTMDLRHANIFAYCATKSAGLIKLIIATINRYMEENPELNSFENVKFRMAAGPIGVEAAGNEVVAKAQIWNLTWALLGLFLFCSINFRSFVAGFILTVPLAISNLIGFALMALYGIGLTVSTYPVSSVAIGLGVDYGIYFV
ncbi:MAG: hypothetical protein JRI52_09785, partial [Deltaproteobacteria bacterium]|nr:hypothetical protein [Deltaproteobacteria bacterium]